MAMTSKARGSVLLEILSALVLATVFLAGFTSALTTQAVELHAAQKELTARQLLLSAQERLRSGSLTPPSVGAERQVVEEKGIRVTLQRLDPSGVDPRLRVGGLQGVVLSARWTSRGTPHTRDLVTLVRRGGS